MIINSVLDRLVGTVDACPWSQASGRDGAVGRAAGHHRPLYTPEERRRRDETP